MNMPDRDRDLENSIITRTMRDGMMDGEPRYCGKCGREVGELAYDEDGVCVGCRECITFRPAWEGWD